jgi:hypothetical protein
MIGSIKIYTQNGLEKNMLQDTEVNSISQRNSDLY